MKTENLNIIYQKCREIAAEVGKIKHDPASLIVAEMLISSLEDTIQNQISDYSDFITGEIVDEACEECIRIISEDVLNLISKQLDL